MKTTRSKLFELANNCRLGVSHLDDGFILDALEAFYRLAYTTGQKDQREKDVEICAKFKIAGLRTVIDAVEDAIRRQSNED